MDSNVIGTEFLSRKLEEHSGVVVSGTGTLNSGDGGVSESSPDDDWQAINEEIESFSRETVYGYDYFDHKLGSPDPNLSGATLSSNDIVDETQIYKTDGTITGLNGSWADFDKTAIILVDGSLDIDKDITVVDGVFLAFIVKDNLTIASGVGTNPDPLVGEQDEVSLEGVFVVNGNIKTGESSIPGQARLVARGIFVADSDLDGTGGFNFQRDLGETLNETMAAEVFEYRPDFLFNAPEELLKEGVSWEEIVP